MGWILGLIFILIIIVLFCKMFKNASNEDDLRDKLFQEYIEEKNNRNTVLSDLEKETVKELKKELIKDFDIK